MNNSPADTTKVKEPIHITSIIGFISSVGYFLSSTLFWVLSYLNEPYKLFRDNWYKVGIAFISALLFAAGLALSITGVLISAQRGYKRSERYGIAGLTLICVGFFINVVLIILDQYVR